MPIALSTVIPFHFGNGLTKRGRADMGPGMTRRKAIRVGGLAGLGGVLAACSNGTTGSSSSSSSSLSSSSRNSAALSSTAVTLDQATVATLDSLFDKIFDSTGLAGMGAAVWIGSDVWRRSAGYADLETKAVFRPTDHVRIASITKSYTATAVLQLVDQGELALTDTLESFVPGVTNGAEITLDNLLGMTSGIYDFTSDDKAVGAFDADPTMEWSDAQTLAVIARHEPLFAPGAEISYCDSNYALLGMILAKVTGRPPGEVITSNVIDKLQLPNTSYPTAATITEKHPTGYVPPVKDPNAPFDNAKAPPKVVTELNPNFPSTAGAMISTLDDLKVWGNEIATGSLLDPATQVRRLDSKPFPGQKINVGYGLGCETLNEFVGHNGAILGFSSVVMCRPPGRRHHRRGGK